MATPARDAFDAALAAVPLVAILRGLEPEAADAIGDVLFECGLRVVEVPLNSPRPLESIARLARRFSGRLVVGAGTVLDVADVGRVQDAGGTLIVAPNADAEVIRAAASRGLVSAPGVFTPSEAFAALAAGADVLKLFPADAAPPAVIKAWKAVLPKATRIMVVGGVDASTIPTWASAGADGYGIGSALFAPGRAVEDIRRRGRELVEAVQRAGR